MATFTLFKNLREKYTTWTELSQFLQSEEGGEFSIRESSPYAVIRYNRDKNVLTSENSLLRSFVWNMETHLPVCLGPGKAMEGLPPLNTSLTVEEFLDGVMINMFIERASPSQVHMSSRSYLGATGNFYSKRSFGELAKESLQKNFGSLNPFSSCDSPRENESSTFASFVLSHPEHRVVAKVFTPRIFAVQYGTVLLDGTVRLYNMYPHAFENPKLFNNFILPLPKKTFTSEEEMSTFIRENALHRGWTWQGFVFKDSSGNRWRMRNPTYTYLRSLRGNESNAAQRFVRLRAEGKVKEYLKHYSEDSNMFWSLEQKLRSRTQEIYDSYCAVHKSHEKKFADLEQPDKTIVFKLHSYYLTDLREQQQPLQKKHVVDLVNSLPLWEQALLLRDKVVEQPASS